MNKVWYCLIVYQFLFFLVGEIKPNVRLSSSKLDDFNIETIKNSLSPFDELRVTNGLNSNVRLSKPVLSLSKDRSLTENFSDNSNFNQSHFDKLSVTEDLNSNVRLSKPP
jgi:hypothetical protein